MGAFRRKSPKRERLRLKAITTPVTPTLKDMTYRLRLEALLFPAYVCFDGEFDLDFRTPFRLQAVAAALDIPELSEVEPINGDAVGEETTFNEVLDEVAVIVHSHMTNES